MPVDVDVRAPIASSRREARRRALAARGRTPGGRAGGLSPPAQEDAMPIDLERSFEVDAPVEQVWDFLVDPERVVPCLPSARVLERVDERTFEGEIGFTLGPFGAKLRGEIEFETIEPDRHRVVLTGHAEDTRRDARARMVMESHLSPVDGGGTLVEVAQTVTLSGSLTENMLTRNVADMLFGRFVSCVQSSLA